MSTVPPVPPTERRRRPGLLGSLFALVLVIAAWYLFTPRNALEPEPPAPVVTEDAAAATRTVTLFFADAESRDLVAEERDLSEVGLLDTRVAATVRALVDGPRRDGVRTLPAAARLLHVFLDDESSTVYLDFDPALVTRHPGGTTAESMTLASIVRTLKANFPEVARVQLLVDGEPVQTLAGHVDTSQPIEIATWK
jgi:spore germination protein GerM